MTRRVPLTVASENRTRGGIHLVTIISYMLRIHGISASSGIRGLQMGRWDNRLSQESSKEARGESTGDRRENRSKRRRVAVVIVVTRLSPLTTIHNTGDIVTCRVRCDRSNILTTKIINSPIGAHNSVILGQG